MNIALRLSENATRVERELERLSAEEDVDFAAELAAERYCLTGRAKRIRPTLVLEFCRLFGGADAAALPLAAAVEMVHTYSLIHDDLPCMDNADLRRGRSTCHKAYGEAIALLAGDGLLTRAFGVIATADSLPSGAAVAAVAALSGAAGSFGMIGGQVMDLRGEKERLSLEQLLKLHAHKTGALISVSAEMGCLAAGLTVADPRTMAAKRFAAGIGLAFQVIDDILDATSQESVLGKSVGSDAHKTTFLTYYTTEEALAFARAETNKAKEALNGMAGADVLLALADYLTERKF